MQEYDIQDILTSNGVITFFQPIVSVKKRAVLGFEALSRGSFDGVTPHIPPNVLFAMTGSDVDNRVELDRLCRFKAFESFQCLHHERRELLISVNLDVAILDTSAAGSDHLLHQVREAGIDPNNIIIELIESKVQNTDALTQFIETYREHGFLIALDDVGTGHSNLERIAALKPDIIKIDRSLVSNIDRIFHKQEVVKALSILGNKLGAMVLAEGIEREEEALKCLQLGLDVFQGFYFGKPGLADNGIWSCLDKVHSVASRFKQCSIDLLNAQRGLFESYNVLLSDVLGLLEHAPPGDFGTALATGITLHSHLECLYLLDAHGKQVTDTVCNPLIISSNKRFIYHPAQRGADHSLKDYFLPISAGLSRYTTDAYVSMASGNLCSTISTVFKGMDGQNYILCMDVARI